MQKRAKLFVFFLCVAVTLLCCSALSTIAAQNETPSDTRSAEERIAGQKQAVAANEDLIEYFFNNGYVTEYPEYFGGCYIADNCCHVRLVSPTEQEMEMLESILGPYGNAVVYEYGEYSQAELQELADATASELLTQGYRVTQWYVDAQIGNAVIRVLGEDVESARAWITDRQGDALSEIVIEEGSYVSLD